MTVPFEIKIQVTRFNRFCFCHGLGDNSELFMRKVVKSTHLNYVPFSFQLGAPKEKKSCGHTWHLRFSWIWLWRLVSAGTWHRLCGRCFPTFRSILLPQCSRQKSKPSLGYVVRMYWEVCLDLSETAGVRRTENGGGGRGGGILSFTVVGLQLNLDAGAVRTF
jgi:hypothetical protein